MRSPQVLFRRYYARSLTADYSSAGRHSQPLISGTCSSDQAAPANALSSPPERSITVALTLSRSGDSTLTLENALLALGNSGISLPQLWTLGVLCLLHRAMLVVRTWAAFRLHLAQCGCFLAFAILIQVVAWFFGI
jgi:hypothetical protein